jgi:hypothetical protein
MSYRSRVLGQYRYPKFVSRGKSGRLISDTTTFFKQFGIEDMHPDEQEYMEYIEVPLRDEDGNLLSDDERLKIEQDMIEEWGGRYTAAVESAIRDFLTSSPIRGVEDVDIDFSKDRVVIKVSDKEKFLDSIRQTINGVGMFYAPSNEELVEQTHPGEPNKVIETHIHWLASVPEVWGTKSIRERVDDRLR